MQVRSMKAGKVIVRGAAFRTFEFRFPGVDTLIKVEAGPDGAVIRASRDTFSASRKLSFIRELVAEGFVDDVCLTDRRKTRLRWIVDPRLNLGEVKRTA